MKYILITESMILLFFLCKLLDALTKRIYKQMKKEPLGITNKKKRIREETNEERKARLVLENIDNYATGKAQQDVK